MSLYPSLEDMKIDNMVRAQMAQQQHQAPPSNQLPYQAQPAAVAPSAPRHVYPALGEYMGLELSPGVIALNMPEYQIQTVHPSGAATNIVAPLSSQSPSLLKATVTQGIRQVILCKDKHGKCGLRLHSVNNGIFVCYVEAGSPAALAGLRFGDQILEINDVAMAGLSMEQSHALLKKAPTNGIRLAVRDRPFERTVTLHKDSLGHIGFQFKDGKIVALVKDSSAARNGLLTDHQLLEINTINVVSMKDKEISRVIEASPSIVNVTIIPYYIYKHMISKMSSSLFKEQDRTPAV